ncbi:hypothetical protein DFP72DRAFT_875624 [Ephemerocybe angulata]|uniref:Uncharacterized protein n=1 Tax=Ephemerocybe angulata TaxID=980116 RepID=A0A8H6IDE4_9AGAR|nr:hypothetical protein DFP72DRAFT_875586 [Tulosesus angulatus]KAF6763438.1 hypothetical protein DFP72DRAFT_875624 [Tulosesus angulatus]
MGSRFCSPRRVRRRQRLHLHEKARWTAAVFGAKAQTTRGGGGETCRGGPDATAAIVAKVSQVLSTMSQALPASVHPFIQPQPHGSRAGPSLHNDEDDERAVQGYPPRLRLQTTATSLTCKRETSSKSDSRRKLQAHLRIRRRASPCSTADLWDDPRSRRQPTEGQYTAVRRRPESSLATARHRKVMYDADYRRSVAVRSLRAG